MMASSSPPPPSLGIVRLWRIEQAKLFRMRSFWIISGLYLLLIPLLHQFFINSVVQVGEQEIQAAQFFALSGVALWEFMMFTGSYGVYLFVLLLLSYTNQEREQGLWRQYVSEGMPRADLVSGKALLVVALSTLATGILVAGWAGITLAAGAGAPALTTILTDMFCYGLYFAGFLSLAFTLNLFVRRTSLSFILVLLWGLVLESIIRWLDPSSLTQWLPVYAFNGLISNPLQALLDGGSAAAGGGERVQPVLKSIAWTLSGLVLSYIITQRRDLS